MVLRKSRVAAGFAAFAVALAPASALQAQAKRPVGVRAAPAVLPPAASPEAVGFDSARLAKLDAYMAKVVADGRVAGMTTLLARHGQIVSFKTYGERRMATHEPMTPDTIVRIYSMTKP